MTSTHELLLAETRRRLLGESMPRIHLCLDLLSETEIWDRANSHSNSVGNLVLHLCGNVRQWLLSALGKQPDTRMRDAEFVAVVGKDRAALKAMLQELEREVDLLLEKLSADELLADYAVQGFRESGVAILLHVVEHFSYHTGQITCIVKAMRDVDTGYYAGQEL